MRLASIVVAVLASVLVTACGPSGGGSGCKDTLIAGDLVITEVFADFQAPAGGTGADAGKEWFEIYNASDRPIELKGLTLVHARPDGSKSASHEMTDVTIAPGQFLTLGNSADDLLPSYIDYGYSGDLGEFYNTGGGTLALKCGDTEIDSALYDGVKSGHSRQLTSGQPPDYTLNDVQDNWCQGNDTEFDTGNFGTPTGENDCAPVIVGQCNDGGTMRAAVAPMPGDLVITEVMPGPAKVSDTLGEWFEAKVMADVDLNGVGLDRAGDSTPANVITSADCIHVTAGSYVVFAKSADMAMNGGLPASAVVGTFKFSMVAGTTAAPGDVQIVSGSTVIDAITWPKSVSGKSLSLDPDVTDAIANDNASNFCDGVAPYGLGDLGTPGAENAQCSTQAMPGQCSDAGTPRAIVKPVAGALVITELMINPKIENVAGQEWFEIVNTGATAFDLNELGLDQAAGTRPPDLIQSSDCKSVPPGGYAVFARSNDPTKNGMLGTVDATFGFSMSNTSGDVQVVDGATVLDSVTWTSVSATMYDGVSLQLDPDLYTTTMNDTVPGPSYCIGTAPYGDQTNKGTPRTANAQCP